MLGLVLTGMLLSLVAYSQPAYATRCDDDPTLPGCKSAPDTKSNRSNNSPTRNKNSQSENLNVGVQESECADYDPTCGKSGSAEIDRKNCGKEAGVNSIRDINKDNCAVIAYILVASNALSAAAALIIVMMLVVAGIRYSTAGDDANKVQSAKKMITGALFALVIFVFTVAIIQWLVPGGLL